MATKTFYCEAAAPHAGTTFRNLQEGGSVAAATLGLSAWHIGTGHVGDYALFWSRNNVTTGSGAWTTSALPSAAPTTANTGDGWRSTNTITGQFANTDWLVKLGLRSIDAAFTGTLTIYVKLWKSANSDMSSATQIGSGTASASTTNLTTIADDVININVSPGGITTFTNEYLYLQCAIGIDANSSGSSSADAHFRLDSSAGYGIVTPDFSTGGGSPNQAIINWVI